MSPILDTTPTKSPNTIPANTPTTMLIGPYTVIEEKEGLVISVERPGGMYSYRYFFQPVENCNPREILPN